MYIVKEFGILGILEVLLLFRIEYFSSDKGKINL